MSNNKAVILSSLLSTYKSFLCNMANSYKFHAHKWKEKKQSSNSSKCKSLHQIGQLSDVLTNTISFEDAVSDAMGLKKMQELQNEDLQLMSGM